jgi:sugar lactone lactonase YvrE
MLREEFLLESEAMMNRIPKPFLLFTLILSLAAVPVFAQDAAPEATEESSAPSSEAPELIEVNVPGLFPEGIEWDAARGRFLLSSLSGQGINAVADDGTITPFASAENSMSAVGIHIDEATNRLLVNYSDASVFGDPEATGQAALGIYDLETADLIHYVDLTPLHDGRHFANDLTVDAEGNAYVTDSFSPVIYQVTPDGAATVFVEDERLSNPNIGLNGIDYHPAGFLLTSVAGTPALYKIPVDDPTALSEVALSEPFGADGMVLDDAGNLIAVAQFTGEDGSQRQEVVSVSSADDWATATIDQRAEVMGATTATIRDGVVYVSYAHLDQLGAETPPETFEIGRVDFPTA